MEDIKREYEGEPSRLTQIHESKPPKRPEKIAIDSASRTMSEDPPRKSYSQAISTNNANNELRATSEAPNSLTTNRPEKPDKTRAAENQTLWRQMEDLQKQLRDARSRAEGTERELLKQLREANNRADQAERAAEGLIRQLKARTDEVPASSGDSSESIKSLMAENKDLKAELDDARSHIFSLQPYRKDLTPEEVGQEFDDLVNNVTDWVTKLIEPILDDDDKIDEALAVAKKKPHEAMSLKHKLHSDADLAFGCMFPDTDIDILITIVMRFLQDRIFQKVLFETIPHAVEVLSYIESSMQTNVEPKRGKGSGHDVF
jgi:chromosome segregation ATPase